MPNSEAEKDGGAGAREFEAWAAIDATFSFRDAFMAGRAAGWAARGKADADVYALLAECEGALYGARYAAIFKAMMTSAQVDLDWAHTLDVLCAKMIDFGQRTAFRRAPSPAPTDTKEGTTKAPE